MACRWYWSVGVVLVLGCPGDDGSGEGSGEGEGEGDASGQADGTGDSGSTSVASMSSADASADAGEVSVASLPTPNPCEGECADAFECCEHLTEAGEELYTCLDGMWTTGQGRPCPDTPPTTGEPCLCGNLGAYTCEYYDDCPTGAAIATCTENGWTVEDVECPACGDAPCETDEICLGMTPGDGGQCAPNPCEGEEVSCDCAEQACVDIGCTCNSVTQFGVVCFCG